MTQSPDQDNRDHQDKAGSPPAAPPLQVLQHQWWSAWSFFTRLPCPPHTPQPLGAAAWAFPGIGFVIGGIGAAIMAIALYLGIGSLGSAAIAVALIVWLTGALHEDGLADFADAFGLPRSAERTHTILKDPRMGAFGVVALVLSLLLRVVLAAEAGPLALLAAEMLSRSAMASTMSWSPAAGEGLARSAGNASTAAAIIPGALALGLAIALTGPVLLWGVLLAACAGIIILAKSKTRLGGYTGDVLGTVQQVVLLALLLGTSLGP